MSVPALEVTVTAPVVSFRNPLYVSVQTGLPCPPPATVAGMLAACAGGWQNVPAGLCFGYAFRARGRGVDLETYHPLDAGGRKADPRPREREFLAGVTLTVWLVDEPEFWRGRMRRPVWPLRLGRSQDLADARTRTVSLSHGTGVQGCAVVPAHMTRQGTLLQLPTTVSLDRSRTSWGTYRYHATGAADPVTDALVDPEGQAVVPLERVHPLFQAVSP